MLPSAMNGLSQPYLSRGLFVKQSFTAIILGGTGQVGGAVVTELLAISECREVVMVTRKPIAPRSRVRNVFWIPALLTLPIAQLPLPAKL